MHPCCTPAADVMHPPCAPDTLTAPLHPLSPLCNSHAPLLHPCRSNAALLPLPAAPLQHPHHTPAAALPYGCCFLMRPYYTPALSLMHPYCTPATPTVHLLHPCYAPTLPLPYPCCTRAAPLPPLPYPTTALPPLPYTLLHPLVHPLPHPCCISQWTPFWRLLAFTGAQLEGSYLPDHPAIHHLPPPPTLHARVPLMASDGGQEGNSTSMLHHLGHSLAVCLLACGLVGMSAGVTPADWLL